jgi:hypothetical protein
MKIFISIFIISCIPIVLKAQLFVASGDSIYVSPGLLFTSQETALIDSGKIFHTGMLTLNGTVLQMVAGPGTVQNLTADNNALMLTDFTVTDSIQVNPGKVFDIATHQLTDGGNITGTGLLKASPQAQLILNGDGNSVINMDATTNESSNAFKKITINGASGNINFQNKLYVYDALLLNAGSITLNEEMVLRSNDSVTARVGPVGSTINYGSNGQFAVERYIPGRRAWRLLTTPLTAASNVKISDGWQDGAPRVTNVNVINGINNPNPGYGTHVTFGNPATNGYDQGINGNTSIRYLNSTGWNGVPTATNDGSTANSGLITDQPGFMLFVRGNRGTQLNQATGAVTTPTVLRPKGKINTGNLNLSLAASYNNGLGSIFRVVNNPYPSAINFHSLITHPNNVANGFADAYYVWDPTVTGNNAVGGFVGLSYNATASAIAGYPVYDRNVLTGGSTSINSSGDIPSSSAFVINYTGAATTIRASENHKSSSASTNTFFRPVRQIRTTLLAVNNDGTISINDGVLASFDENYSDTVDNKDLVKLDNFAENFSIRHGKKTVCIDRRSPLKISDTIFYQLTKMKQKRYQLELSLDQIKVPNSTGAYVEDLFLQKKYPISLSGNSMYDFSITNNAASADTNRLRLVFTATNRFVSINGQLVNDDIVVDWAIADTFAIERYEIERSVEGSIFLVVATVANDILNWKDLAVTPGIYQYRIKAISRYGVISYTPIAKVIVPKNTSRLYVFPNPTNGNQINVHLKNQPIGIYNYSLFDVSGKQVHSGQFSLTGNSALINIKINQLLVNGTHLLQITNPTGIQQTFKVMVQLD